METRNYIRSNLRSDSHFDHIEGIYLEKRNGGDRMAGRKEY